MPRCITVTRIEQLTREVSSLEAHVGQDAGGPSDIEAQFFRIRHDAVALCKTLPGAHVAAMQIGAAGCSPRGIARVVELLERVRQDLGGFDEHAA